MRMKVIAIVGLVCFFGLLTARQGLAAIYKYVDKDGLTTLVNDLQSVPPEYRATAKIVSGEAGEETASSPVQQREQPASRQGSVAERNAAPEALHQKTADAAAATGSPGRRAMVSAVVVVSSAFLFVMLGIFDTDRGKAIKVARLGLLGGVSVYLLVAHTADVVKVIQGIGGGIESVKRHSEEKGKRAAGAVKAWETILEKVGPQPDEPGKTDQEKPE